MGSSTSDAVRDPSPTTKSKAKNVTFACRGCQKLKSKCDGQNPCAKCASRKTDCVYDGRPGMSRLQAMKNRVDMFEELFETIKTASPSEVTALTDRIRSGALDNTAPVNLKKMLETLPNDTKQNSPRQQSEASQSTPATLSKSDSSADSTAPSMSSPPATPEPSTLPPKVQAVFDRMAVSYRHDDEAHTKSAVFDPLQDSLLLALADNLDNVYMPRYDITKTCIVAYLELAGDLFQAFVPDHVYGLVKKIYVQPDAVKDKLDICQVAAAAAVGAFYVTEDHALYSQISEHFYRIAKTYLEEIIEASARGGISVAVCLTICNLFRKQTAALGYIELAVSLARREGYHTSKRPTGIADADWIAGRRLWRTAMFFQAWLAETLTCIPGSWRPDCITDLEIYDEPTILDVVNTKMTQIACLKANIVHQTSVSNGLTLLAVSGMLGDLRSWYNTLPWQMELRNVVDPSIEVKLRRLVYYAHLLYLGAMMLLYRVLLRHERERKHGVVQIGYATAAPFLGEGLAAAKASARVFRVLHSEEGVVRRCWLAIYNAYVSCLIILHSAAQDQVNNIPISADDIDSALPCLGVLEFCAENDSVAAKFYSTLRHYYGLLRKRGSPDSRKTSPAEIAEELLALLCRPLDTSLREASSGTNQGLVHNDGMSKSLVEHLDVHYEDSPSHMYSWGRNPSDLTPKLEKDFSLTSILAPMRPMDLKNVRPVDSGRYGGRSDAVRIDESVRKRTKLQ